MIDEKKKIKLVNQRNKLSEQYSRISGAFKSLDHLRALPKSIRDAVYKEAEKLEKKMMKVDKEISRAGGDPTRSMPFKE